MVLCQLLLLLLREVLWVAFCWAVLASFVLVCIEERGKRKAEAAEAEADTAGDDRSRSKLERAGGGEERCDLGGLGIGDGVEVGDEGEVFDECPERGGGLGAEGVGVLEPGEDGVKEKKMDGSDGGVFEVVCESASGDGGADGLNVGVGVLEVNGDVKGQGVGDGVGFDEKKLVEDNGEVVEAEVLNGGQARVSSRMEDWVAGAVRALERCESVAGGGDDGEANGNVFDVENRGFREADTGKRSLVEDDAENKCLVEDDNEKKKLNEDELDERKNLIDDENERVVQGETEMKKSDEDENQELFKDLVDNERLVEDDHGNNQSTELDDDDDWEGIERTELEKRFGAAVAYIGHNENEECLSKLSSIVKMQLYGLHKVATQGPCVESQPSIFQVSARANWNAWRQVGDMCPEEAMEKYIALLSENVDYWMEDDIAGARTD